MRITSMHLLAAHLFGDYIFQTDKMATKKLTDSVVRARHVTRYVLCFVPLMMPQRVAFWRKLAFLLSLWLAHYATDSKRWLPNENWAPGTIINDQALHAAQLAVLSGLIR